MNSSIQPEGQNGPAYLTPVKPVSRRQFLTGAAGVAGAAALIGGAHLSPGNLLGIKLAQAQALNSDLDILQFALALEYLETSTYNLINSRGMLSGMAAQYAQKFGENENVHVATIIQTIRALGGTPITPPDVFNLPPLATERDIVMFLMMSEDVGAGAYLGAAPLIQNKDILAAGIALHNVEGQHGSAYKALLDDPMPSPAFGIPLTPAEVITAAKNAYGPNALTQGAGPSPRIIVGNNPPSEPVPPPGGSAAPSTGTSPGMPRTGAEDLFPAWAATAGLIAAAVGAMLRIRSREGQQDTNGS